MCDEPRPTRRRRRLLWLLPLLALAAALYATRPRPNQLVWYTSPPMDGAGTRVRLLVPAGWEVDADSNGSDVLVFSPKSPPRWLRWLRFSKQEEFADLVVAWGPGAGTGSEEMVLDPDSRHGNRSRTSPAIWTSAGYVEWAAPHLSIYVQYGRQDKAAFDATHAAIYRSVQVFPRASQRSGR